MITLDQAGQGVASARVFPPPPDLRPFVEHWWIQTYEGRVTGAENWRIVPDVSPHVIYSRPVDRDSPGRASGVGRLAIVGPRRAHTDIDVSRRMFTSGVRLRPGALPLLLGVPAVELLDRSVRAEEALGEAGRQALERALEASEPRAVSGAIFELLRALLPVGGAIEPRMAGALDLLSRRRAGLSQSDVARQLTIGERTLRLLARTEVGLSPNRIARVFRAQRALRLALREPPGRWAHIAARVGYHDQSHLIRDFRILLGETPEEFLRRGPTRPQIHCRVLQSQDALDR